MQAHFNAGHSLHERYLIVGLIGTGGMGAIYLADDSRLDGRQCAIKETFPASYLSVESFENARRQFHREASILSRLDHPGLPKVSDYFSVGDRDYLVMDFVPGQDLQQLLQSARREGRFIPEGNVLDWIVQLCNTLSYLHHQQPPVLHRDIKPANIKLTPDGRIKLVDFGLVKPLDPNNPSTITGLQGVGSLPYTPLEQYVGELEHTDTRSDLYSLAATTYHLLTGELPASAQSRFINPKVLVPPHQLNPAINSTIEAAILSGMMLHPHLRPASVEIWREMLHLSNYRPTADLRRALRESVLPSAPATTLTSIIRENLLLFFLAMFLLIASIVVTFALSGH